MQQSNRLIPAIQEELRTPSPAAFISRSASPALLTITNQISPTIISVTPATPSHPKIRITISDNSSDRHLSANLISESLDQSHCLASGSPQSGFLHDGSGHSPDSVSCHSVHSCPCNQDNSLIDLDVCPKKTTNSLIDLDDTLDGLSPKCISSSTIPQHPGKMPDILNFPTPTLSVSCPTVNKQTLSL